MLYDFPFCIQEILARQLWVGRALNPRHAVRGLPSPNLRILGLILKIRVINVQNLKLII